MDFQFQSRGLEYLYKLKSEYTFKVSCEFFFLPCTIDLPMNHCSGPWFTKLKPSFSNQSSFVRDFFSIICHQLVLLSSLSCWQLVYDRNPEKRLVSVSETETKVPFWYRYQSWNFFSRNQNFQFSVFSCFPLLSLGYQFLKYLRNGSKFGFNDPFVMEKNTPYYR